MPVSQECLEARTKESKRVCNFLAMFTRLEPTATGGERWFACEGTGVSTGGRAHSSRFFLQCRRTKDVVRASFIDDSAWICARRTTHQDLASVIPDKKEREREKNKCKSVTVVNLCGPTFPKQQDL